MKKYTVAIDISPLSSGHKIRGVGHYVAHLKEALEKEKQDRCNLLFFSHRSEVKGNVDLWHIPYFDPFFLQVPLTNLSQTVVTVHDLTPLVLSELFPKGVKGSLKWQLNRLILQQLAGIITPSQASKKDIEQFARVTPEKIFVTPLGVDSQFKKIAASGLSGLRKKYNLPQEFALYVGDVTPNKNLPRLVRALYDKHIPLVMVGKSITDDSFDRTNAMNQDRMYVRQFAQEKQEIIFTGFVSDEELVGLYNLATCVVYPSLYEGFGLPLVQSMACGTPVVASRSSSLTEIAGDSALLVNPLSEKEIGDAVEKVFMDQKLRAALIEKGLVRAKFFSWQKTAQETLTAYEEILHI